MKAQRNEAHKATGRDLVLVKAAVIEDELAKLGMNFSTRRKGRRLVAKDAFDAGHAAGQRRSPSTPAWNMRVVPRLASSVSRDDWPRLWRQNGISRQSTRNRDRLDTGAGRRSRPDQQ